MTLEKGLQPVCRIGADFYPTFPLDAPNCDISYSKVIHFDVECACPEQRTKTLCCVLIFHQDLWSNLCHESPKRMSSDIPALTGGGGKDNANFTAGKNGDVNRASPYC